MKQAEKCHTLFILYTFVHRKRIKKFLFVLDEKPQVSIAVFVLLLYVLTTVTEKEPLGTLGVSGCPVKI